MSYYNFIFLAFGLAFCFIDGSRSHALVPRSNCDIKKCPGPLYYYEEIGCTPVYENETSCCPMRFNCDRWKNYSYDDDCLINGHVYKSAEKLKSGDLPSLCDHCYCQIRSCSSSQCAAIPHSEKPGCRNIPRPLGCCGWLEVCDDNPFKCVVDGKTYSFGDQFKPQAEPEKTCYCLEGYNGVNDENYCRWKKPSWCRNVIENIYDIVDKCAPIYENNATLHTDCNASMRCPRSGRDEVIPKTEPRVVDKNTASKIQCKDSDTFCKIAKESDLIMLSEYPSPSDNYGPDMHCEFGNLTMNIGDRLNEITDWNDKKVDCVCEVPPVPTCRYDDSGFSKFFERK